MTGTLLFVLHGFITLAAAVVLIVQPQLIPGAVGIRLQPEAYLLAYLLGAAELGMACLSFIAARSKTDAVTHAAALVFIVFHLATAGVELLALRHAAGPGLWINIAVRVVAAALFARYGLRKTARPGS